MSYLLVIIISQDQKIFQFPGFSSRGGEPHCWSTSLRVLQSKLEYRIFSVVNFSVLNSEQLIDCQPWFEEGIYSKRDLHGKCWSGCSLEIPTLHSLWSTRRILPPGVRPFPVTPLKASTGKHNNRLSLFFPNPDSYISMDLTVSSSFSCGVKCLIPGSLIHPQ